MAVSHPLRLAGRFDLDRAAEALSLVYHRRPFSVLDLDFPFGSRADARFGGPYLSVGRI